MSDMIILYNNNNSFAEGYLIGVILILIIIGIIEIIDLMCIICNEDELANNKYKKNK